MVRQGPLRVGIPQAPLARDADVALPLALRAVHRRVRRPAAEEETPVSTTPTKTNAFDRLVASLKDRNARLREARIEVERNVFVPKDVENRLARLLDLNVPFDPKAAKKERKG